MKKAKLLSVNEEVNLFASLLYRKPKGFFKERIYYFKKIRPILKKIEKGPIPFIWMVEFSNFVKILEMVWFYHNDIKYVEGLDEDIRIISDNKIDDNTKKNLTILLEKQKVTIIINMERFRDEDIDTITTDVINIDCRNEFGKKLNTKFEIVDGKITGHINDNTYNLMYNINHILQESMYKLFKTYYNKA